MDPRDAGMTAFITRRGIFRFNVMPFVLSNAPVTFQRLMNVARAGLGPLMRLVYLDNISIHSVDFRPTWIH